MEAAGDDRGSNSAGRKHKQLHALQHLMWTVDDGPGFLLAALLFSCVSDALQ